MAFSIRINQPFDSAYSAGMPEALAAWLAKDGRFSIGDIRCKETFKGLPRNSPRPTVVVELRRIRLTAKNPYCGQHWDSCENRAEQFPLARRKRMVASYLEREDWIQFNSLINDFIDHGGVSCDVWSTPMECKGALWIRKENKRRYRYDFQMKPREVISPFTGVAIEDEVWDNGTDVNSDQYKPEPVGIECVLCQEVA